MFVNVEGSKMCRFEDYPPILIKKKGSNTVRESSLLGFIEGYAHCKHEVIAAYKPRFSFFPKKWRDYHFFETEYRKVRADAKQLKKLDRLNAEYDSNITYVEARELISKLEKQLAPTPSVCKALKRYGEDPANYTREKADRFLEEKEQEEENKAKLKWKDNLTNFGITFNGDVTSLDISDIEQFDELAKELKRMKLEYPYPSSLSPESFPNELNLLDEATCFYDDVSDYQDSLRECEEIKRKLKKSELKVLFPDYILLLKSKKREVYDHNDIKKLIKKHFSDIVE